MRILCLCSSQPAISTWTSSCWRQCDWHNPEALLVFKKELQLTLLLWLYWESCVKRIYLQRYKAETNVIHLLSLQMRSQRISKRVITTERKESKINWTMCGTSKDHRQELQRMFECRSGKRKPLYLAGKGADAAGARHTTPLGSFIPSVMSLGQRLGASLGLSTEKEKNGSNLALLQCKETTGRPAKAVPQKVTLFPLLVCSLSKWDCPHWG